MGREALVSERHFLEHETDKTLQLVHTLTPHIERKQDYDTLTLQLSALVRLWTHFINVAKVTSSW